MTSSPLRPPLAPSGQRWFVLTLMLFFVALSVQHTHKVLARRSAFTRWQPQVRGLEEGIDIAQRFNYPNPPIMALMLLPLAKLSPQMGALLWFYLKVGMTLLALRWVFQLVADTGRPFPMWARILTVLLALRPIMGDLQHGNVNLFILFLVIAALTAWRSGRDLLAGILLGLAIACKVTPALFVPYLLWKRAWRALAGCAAGLVLFLWPGLVPALFLGFDVNQRQLTSWYKDMVRPFVVEGKVTSEHNNQSLPGLIARLATHSPSFSAYPNNVYTPTRYDNLLELTAFQARLLVKGCMALFALLVIWSCRTPTTRRQGWRLGAEFSIVLLGMLLFSERTWKHHCVTLLLPFAVLSYYLAVCNPGRGIRAYLIGSLAAVMILFLATSTVLTGDEAARQANLSTTFAKQAQVYGAYVIAYIVLLAALIVILRQRGSEEAEVKSAAATPVLPAA